MINLSRLNSDSRDVRLLFEDCLVTNANQPGILVLAHRATGPRGFVEFSNCTIQTIDLSGAQCIWNVTSPLKLRFVNCKWSNVGRRIVGSPIELQIKRPLSSQSTGGIEFVNCYVYDDKKRPALAIKDIAKGAGKYRVTGKIHVINPHGDMDDGTPERCTGLDVTYRKRQE